MKSIKVPSVSTPKGYSQIVRLDSNPHIFYISGQTPTDERGNTICVGDFEAQVVQSLENLQKCLAAIDATFHNVVKLTFYVVPMEKFDIVRKVRERYLDQNNLPAITSIGVTSLVNKDWLVEIEALVELKP
jgi:enamine deaminase RidA (YjgF/YER057c/UK114 family)